VKNEKSLNLDQENVLMMMRTMILNISEAMPSVLEWPISHNFFAYSATLFRFINHTETSGLEMVKHKEKKGKQTIYFLSSKWLSSRNIRQSRVVIYEVSLCDFTLTEQIPAFLSFQYTFFVPLFSGSHF
jgi:hypothetical protein